MFERFLERHLTLHVLKTMPLASENMGVSWRVLRPPSPLSRQSCRLSPFRPLRFSFCRSRRHHRTYHIRELVNSSAFNDFLATFETRGGRVSSLFWKQAVAEAGPGRTRPTLAWLPPLMEGHDYPHPKRGWRNFATISTDGKDSLAPIDKEGKRLFYEGISLRLRQSLRQLSLVRKYCTFSKFSTRIFKKFAKNFRVNFCRFRYEGARFRPQNWVCQKRQRVKRVFFFRMDQTSFILNLRNSAEGHTEIWLNETRLR